MFKFDLKISIQIQNILKFLSFTKNLSKFFENF